MAADPNYTRMSVEEYLKRDEESLEARYEYIDGIVRLMSGGTKSQSLIQTRVITTLSDRLTGKRCDVFTSDARVMLSSTRYVYPDITISCSDRDRDLGTTLLDPRVVFEVLSPSTEAYDRTRKSDLYRACPSVEEYVLIDSQRMRIELYRRADPFWLSIVLGPEAQVELTSLEISFPVAALYRDVPLPPEIEDEQLQP